MHKLLENIGSIRQARFYKRAQPGGVTARSKHSSIYHLPLNMFKKIALLLSVAVGAFALPASIIDVTKWEEGLTRHVSGATLGVVVPRQAVTGPAGFNMFVSFSSYP